MAKQIRALEGAGPFAHWLADYMTRLELTQAELARATGFRETAVSNWLRGVTPSSATLRRLAERRRDMPLGLMLELAGHVEATATPDGQPAIAPEKRGVIAEIALAPLSVLTPIAQAIKAMSAQDERAFAAHDQTTEKTQASSGSVTNQTVNNQESGAS